MRTLSLAIVGVALLVAACATTSSRPTRSEFEDIPVPRGLALVDSRSTVIESPTVKAARLVYRGRIEPQSLGVAMRQTLEGSGWRHVSTSQTGVHGTTQVYEKGGNSLQVRIWEEWWFTYVELTASRALQPPTARSQ